MPPGLKPYLHEGLANGKIKVAQERGCLLYHLLRPYLIDGGSAFFMQFASAKEIYQFLASSHPWLQQEITDSSRGFQFSSEIDKHVLQDGWLIVAYRRPHASFPFLISCDGNASDLLLSFYCLSLRRYYHKPFISASNDHALLVVRTSGTIITFRLGAKERMSAIDANVDLFGGNCVVFTLTDRFVFNWCSDDEIPLREN